LLGIDWKQKLTILFISTQVNINPTVFWLLYAIILHPKERAIIEREIAPAFSPSSSDPNVETLSDLDVLLHNAPLLNAMFWEALRSVFYRTVLFISLYVMIKQVYGHINVHT
jgi:hypothetical protein